MNDKTAFSDDHNSGRLKVAMVDVSAVKRRNLRLRKHPQWQIDKIIASIRLYGFNAPILIDEQGFIIAGEARYEAALALGMRFIPVICISDLTPHQIRKFRIADNKAAEGAAWIDDTLQLEVLDLLLEDPALDLNHDLGLPTPEQDRLLNPDVDDEVDAADEQDIALPKIAVSRPGDLFRLGAAGHLVYCGDAEDPKSYKALMGDEVADQIVSDPPFGIKVSAISKSHREFMQGSGIAGDALRAFLKPKIAAMADRTKPGALIFCFIDWRSIELLLAIGRECGLTLVNLVVWNKISGGMGSMYRSSHELVPVFMKPGAPHTNNIQLGRFGRNRRNVIDELGFNSFGRERQKRLSEHPTVKPVNLIAGLLLDASHRGDIVLDGFAGSGTILIAAEKTGRVARAIEIDPIFVDISLRRFEERFGVEAIHVETGLTFSALAQKRAEEREADIALSAAPLPRRRRPPPSVSGRKS